MLTQTDMTNLNTLENDRREVGAALQYVLVDLIDLALLGKHAHWNVEGPRFRTLHLELDELVDAWRHLADDVAERAAALGWAPEGQMATIARSSHIEPFPAGPIRDDDVVAGLTDRLADVIERARVAMGEAAIRDSISEDLLIDVVQTLEKQHWLLRVQTAPAS
jgi:starvation-inducible DNA-binding protein